MLLCHELPINRAMSQTNRLYIARHGETVFNAAARLQGNKSHTPLTRAGFEQADQMGAMLRHKLGPQPDLQLWSSSAGRALQTIAVIAEHLELDWHDCIHDDRLVEIDTGSWAGRYYADVSAEHGPIVDPEHRLLRPSPDGENYPTIATRLESWIAEHGSQPGDKLVIMHGVSSQVMRGILQELEPLGGYDVPIAPSLPQGSVVMIEDGVETLVVEGTGGERT